MASEGADFRQILRHYYPDTTVATWGRQSDAYSDAVPTTRIP
jgi:peptidoglycan hydrolase-like amidase